MDNKSDQKTFYVRTAAFPLEQNEKMSDLQNVIIFRAHDTCQAAWDEVKSLYTKDSQCLYGICQNLTSVIAARQFDGTMVDYLGKVNGLLFDFNELLPLTSTPDEELEQLQSFFMLLALYGPLTEYSLVLDHILGSPNIPTINSAWSTLLLVLAKPFVDVDVPPPYVDSSALTQRILGHKHSLRALVLSIPFPFFSVDKDLSLGWTIGTGCELHGLYQLNTFAHAGFVVDSLLFIHAQWGHPSLAKLQKMYFPICNLPAQPIGERHALCSIGPTQSLKGALIVLFLSFLISNIKFPMGNKSDPKAGATAVPPPRIGKREGENEDEQQVNAKKHKRHEVAEEQRIMDEIVSDDSFEDFEPDKNPEAKKDSLSKQEKKGKPDSANCSGSLESLADGSEEGKGNMDIDEGNHSEECNEETLEKMQVLMDAASNAQQYDLKNVENDSFSNSSDDDNESDDNGSDVIEKPHMPVKSSENSEKGIEEKDPKAPQENPKMLATPNERNAGSKTIVTRNLSYSVERADLENLFKECGEIVDVRLHTDAEGRFRGFGHVEFATAEAAQNALQLNNTELLRCRIRVVIAPQKNKHRSCVLHHRSVESMEAVRFKKFCKGRIQAVRIWFSDCCLGFEVWEFGETKSKRVGFGLVGREWEGFGFHVISSNSSHSFQRSEGTQPVKGSEISGDCEQETEPKLIATCKEPSATSKTIYAKNLAYSMEQDDMEYLFKNCGEIVSIRLHTDHNRRFKGYGHVEFATTEAAQKSIGGHQVVVLVRIGASLLHGCGVHTPHGAAAVATLRLGLPRHTLLELLPHLNMLLVVLNTALELNNTVYLGRRVGVFIAKGKGEYTSNRSGSNGQEVKNTGWCNWSKSFHQSEQTKPIKSTESSEYCEEEVEGKASNSSWESSKRVATLKEQNAPSKTIYVKNLSYRVERADMENLFKECGKIVDVHLHRNPDGRLNGFGQVEFATAEAAKKALELHNTELLRRPIGVDLAEEKGEYTYSRSNWSNSFQKCERDQSPTVFVTGFDSSLPAEKIKASLEEHFGSCGEIQRISIPTFHDSGAVKGFAHLGFKDVVSVRKALHLDQNELGGFHLRVEKAKPRRENQGIGGGRGGGGGHQFGGRDGSGYTSRMGWGRSGGGGWHSLHFSDEGTVCLPKDKGGLGIKDLKTFNTALLGKWRWDLFQQQGELWARILDSKYGGWRSLAEGIRGSNESPWWKDLMMVLHQQQRSTALKNEIAWRVGCGDKIRFWEDCWTGADMGSHTNAGWEWNYIWRRSLFDNEVDMADGFLGETTQTTIQPHRADTWVWKPDPSGQYSTKSAYDQLLGESLGGNLDGAFEELWKLRIPAKTTFFAWRLIRDQLPTKSNLRRRQVEVNDMMCPFCRNKEEDAAHLFFNCSKTLPLWWESLSWVNILGAFPQNPRHHFLQHGSGNVGGIKPNRWKCWWGGRPTLTHDNYCSRCCNFFGGLIAEFWDLCNSVNWIAFVATWSLQ
ncbi:Nucleolin 2 [Glycine soja]